MTRVTELFLNIYIKVVILALMRSGFAKVINAIDLKDVLIRNSYVFDCFSMNTFIGKVLAANFND